MKAVISLDLDTSTIEETQTLVEDACRKLQATGLINDFRFEIETPDGTVTEKCVLMGGKVIA